MSKKCEYLVFNAESCGKKRRMKPFFAGMIDDIDSILTILAILGILKKKHSSKIALDPI